MARAIGGCQTEDAGSGLCKVGATFAQDAVQAKGSDCRLSPPTVAMHPLRTFTITGENRLPSFGPPDATLKSVVSGSNSEALGGDFKR